MNEYNHRTDMFGSRMVVAVGKQKTHWIEFQLLDEQGVPLVNMPYTATNEATRCGLVPVFTGRTDVDGILRLDGLHPLSVTLTIDAEALARTENPPPTRRSARASALEFDPHNPFLRHGPLRPFAGRGAGSRRGTWVHLSAHRSIV